MEMWLLIFKGTLQPFLLSYLMQVSQSVVGVYIIMQEPTPTHSSQHTLCMHVHTIPDYRL